MSVPVAEDFAGIARAMQALRCDAPTGPNWLTAPYWCANCEHHTGGDDADPMCITCSEPVYLHCDTCDNAGWIDQRLGGPATAGWAECPDCHNPNKVSEP